MAVNREWSAVARTYSPLAAGSIDSTDEDPHDRAIIRAMSAKYKANQRINGNPLCTIFVSSLNHITTEDTLHKVFSRYGSIQRICIVRDFVTGFSKGYAFIEYEEECQAVHARSDANGERIDDKQVFVDFENERTMPGWIPRRLGGGLGGKRESGQLRFGGRARPFKKPLIVGQLGDVKSEPTDGNLGFPSDQRRYDPADYHRSSSRRDRSRSRDRDYHRHRHDRDSQRYKRRSRSSSRSRDERSRQEPHDRNRHDYERHWDTGSTSSRIKKEDAH